LSLREANHNATVIFHNKPILHSKCKFPFIKQKQLLLVYFRVRGWGAPTIECQYLLIPDKILIFEEDRLLLGI
jgi:hypothetical protein